MKLDSYATSFPGIKKKERGQPHPITFLMVRLLAGLPPRHFCIQQNALCAILLSLILNGSS